MDALSRQFSRREKVLMLFMAIIIVGAGYYFMVHQPVTETIDIAESEINEYTTENEILRAKAAKKKQMLEEVEQMLIDPDVQEIPAYDNLSLLTAFLNSELKKSTSYDISCGAVQFDEESHIYRRPVQVTCNVRDYKTGEKIIEGITNCQYCSQVNNVTFTPNYRNEVNMETHIRRVENIEDGPITLKLSITFYEAG